ncbi:MAG: FliG C-terminal domain-containing protein [Pseudomonadota bacterium]
MSSAQTPPNEAAPSPLNVTPSQRAAVVIAMLGETAAKPIVDRLDDAAMANVAASLETITYLSRAQLIEIVIDFLRHLRQSSGSLRGGPESARKILSEVLEEPRLQVIYGTGDVIEEEILPEPATTEDYSRIWQQMASREPAHIAKYLEGLTPNITALMLKNLDTTLCSELLCMLPEEMQTKVLGEMVNPPPPTPEIDAVIARMVRMEFLLAPETPDEEDDTQLMSVGEMLSLVPNERRATLMNYLSQSHADKVDPIQKGMFEIADIPELLHRNQVPILFKALDQAFILDVLLCLQSRYAKVAEHFLSNISNRMADQLKSELERMKPLPDEVADAVEKDFLTKMMELKRDEVIVLERPEAPEE